MVQELSSQPSFFGSLGKGIGKGLANYVPKEVERQRLSKGLEQLGQQQGLTPFQQFSGLASTPGITPQMLQSGSDLLRQQAYLDSIKNQYQGQGNQQQGQRGYIPTQEEINQPLKGEVNTLANPEDTAESYKSFIPPPEQQERAEAFQNFNANPARYDYNFDKALDERKAITKRNQEIQQAHQNQEQTAVGKESTVKQALAKEMEKLKLNNIPPKAVQKFEEKILNAVLSKKEGGEGLVQEDAIKKYSKEMDQANRNYLDLGSLSTWSPIDFNRRTNALQKDFASRGEQQLMMDNLISDYGISPTYAAHKAYPLKKGEIPTLDKNAKKITGGIASIENTIHTPLKDNDFKKMKEEMGKKNSPLSIAYEMERRNQDPRPWLNYLNNNRDNLEVWQSDQLTKNLNTVDLKDMWLRAWE